MFIGLQGCRYQGRLVPLPFFDGAEKKHAMDRVVDDLRGRFGKKMIFYAGSMVGGTFLERANYMGGHKGTSESCKLKE